MICGTLGQVGQWLEAEVPEALVPVEFRGVTSDSRAVKPGMLFLCLPGERADGHDFAAQAVKAGAPAVIASRPLPADIPAIQVPDTLLAYGTLAARWRDHLTDTRFIGITGSVGKTTTKEMTAAILSQVSTTVRSEGNHNNNLGLPMTLCGIPEDCGTAVLEMGMNHFGEISYLTRIARPNLVLINNIGTMHIEFLGSREGILKAKMEILEGLMPGGVAVFNGDDDLLWQQKEGMKFKTVYFGCDNPECDVFGSGIAPKDGGMAFHVRGLGQEFDTWVPMAGLHIVRNALAAITIGLLCGVQPAQISEALHDFQNTGSRQRIYEQDGYTIIEDCYNAGPESMSAALELLGSHPCSGRRIAVLGDMLELGTSSDAEHFRVGRLAIQQGIDMIFAYGKFSEQVMSGALTGGARQRDAMAFDSQEELLNVLRSRAAEGDLLLFKGSRGTHMEQVLEKLVGEKKEAEEC